MQWLTWVNASVRYSVVQALISSIFLHDHFVGHATNVFENWLPLNYHQRLTNRLVSYFFPLPPHQANNWRMIASTHSLISIRFFLFSKQISVFFFITQRFIAQIFRSFFFFEIIIFRFVDGMFVLCAYVCVFVCCSVFLFRLIKVFALHPNHYFYIGILFCCRDEFTVDKVTEECFSECS